MERKRTSNRHRNVSTRVCPSLENSPEFNTLRSPNNNRISIIV